MWWQDTRTGGYRRNVGGQPKHLAQAHGQTGHTLWPPEAIPLTKNWEKVALKETLQGRERVRDRALLLIRQASVVYGPKVGKTKSHVFALPVSWHQSGIRDEAASLSPGTLLQ